MLRSITTPQQFWRHLGKSPLKMVSACLVLIIVCPALCWGDERPKSPKNVLLICVDDLRPELGCYGVDYIQSPHIDKLAKQGVSFSHHYVQAPTCGASRYTLLTGRYGPANNMALFQRAKLIKEKPESVSPSMPAWFRQHGYTTVSVGKVSHHPGGRGGKDWDDSTDPEMPDSWDQHLMPSGPWQHPRGAMHGLANGEIRNDAGVMDLFQSTEGPATTYPDGWIVNESLKQLELLSADKKPFFLAVGLIRPHLPFGAPADYYQHYENMTLPPIPHSQKPKGKTTWHSSGEFMKYNRWNQNPNTDPEFATLVRKHYAACVSYADAQVGRLLSQLDKVGATQETIIVLWGDHGWHLGEHAIWGKHALFEESLRSPLILSHSGIQAGKQVNSVVETLDLFPTLCELTSLNTPEFAQGESLVKLCQSETQSDSRSAIAYTSRAKTIRTNTHRLITHSSGEYELYDHRTPDAETQNIASTNQELVRQLQQLLNDKLRAYPKTHLPSR